MATALVIAFLAPTNGFAQTDTAPEELFKMGNEAFTEGKFDEAINHFKRCVAKRPKFKEAWYNLGYAYGRKKQHAKEIEAYKQALVADPNYIKAMYNLALAYEDNGNDDEAAQGARPAVLHGLGHRCPAFSGADDNHAAGGKRGKELRHDGAGRHRGDRAVQHGPQKPLRIADHAAHGRIT